MLQIYIINLIKTTILALNYYYATIYIFVFYK